MAKVKDNIKRHGHPKFYKYLEEMAETHSRKNHDYSEASDPLSNFKETGQQTGDTAFHVIHMHLANKMARIRQLTKKENLVKGEGIVDTLMDLAVYALLGRIALEEAKENK
jgi:hypothetical protein